ncbi:hypothetical protein [Dyella sp. ASV21]|uniref:hypothetical protein n=1 Tax=Dyella sp. ASV21 TaxID=2795114 RepID=UPI0018EE1996|nr:hypothetical protein [Dyella sp. ASV21]
MDRRTIPALLAMLLLPAVSFAGMPTPHLVEGHYYMVGDPACMNGQHVTPTRLMCYDENMKPTGVYRDAMTPEELQADQRLTQLVQSQRQTELEQAQQRALVAQQQAQLEQLQAQLDEQRKRERNAQLNASLQQLGQTMRGYGQTSPSILPPAVQGIPTSGGVGYNQAGNALIGTDGTSCVTSGISTICR